METKQVNIYEDKTLLGILIAVVGSSIFTTVFSTIFYLILTIVFSMSTGLSGDALTAKVDNFYSNYYIGYVVTIISMISIIFVYYLLMGKEKFKSIVEGFKGKKIWIQSIIVGLLFVVVSTAYSILTNMITNTTVNSNQAEVVNLIGTNAILSFIYIVLLAPVVEEIGMRYFIFGSIKKVNKVWAYILGSSIFALLHYAVLLGESNINILSELLAIPTYFGAGLLLCYAYDKSKKLSCPIIIHTFNNLISFLFVIL